MAHIARFTLITTCALLLTACAGSQSGTSTTTPAPQGQSDAVSAAPTGSAAPTSGADVCEYLRGQIPTLEGIGSQVGAMANLTTNLYSWYEKQGTVPNGTQIDEQIAKECPDVATQVYELAGIKSFATL
jgi:hypothetical protein